MTFSRHLLRATVGILAALCLVLFVLVTSYFDRFAGRPYAEIDAFVQLERVERLSRLVSALREPVAASSEPSAAALAKTAPGLFDRLPWVDSTAEGARPYALSCPTRQQEVLAGRLAGQLNLGRDETLKRLALAHAAWEDGGAKGCRAFFVDVDLVMRSAYLLDPSRPLSKPVLEQNLTQLLTERVAWDAKPHCLRIRSSR